jgi:hypothetical protein
MVGLLDRDLAGADRARAEARRQACPACAVLHEDLVALARATTELETPSRPREFTLTPDMAAGLARTKAGEPVSSPARLTGEMTGSRSTHAVHDHMLIANLVDRAPSDGDRALAQEQLANCRDCALLYEDLVALSEATRAMPVQARSRDFTLTQADAERLRARGWRGLLAAIGSSRDAFSRPLAVGLTTLGLAGLLVATIPGALPQGGAASPPAAADAQRNAAGDAFAGSELRPESLAEGSAAPSAAAAASLGIAAAAPSAAPSEAAVPAPAASAPEATPEILVEGGESSPIAGEPQDRGALDTYISTFSGDAPGGLSPMLILAAVLLATGLGLFGLRWRARRLGDG